MGSLWWTAELMCSVIENFGLGIISNGGDGTFYSPFCDKLCILAPMISKRKTKNWNPINGPSSTYSVSSILRWITKTAIPTQFSELTSIMKRSIYNSATKPNNNL